MSVERELSELRKDLGARRAHAKEQARRVYQANKRWLRSYRPEPPVPTWRAFVELFGWTVILGAIGLLLIWLLEG